MNFLKLFFLIIFLITKTYVTAQVCDDFTKPNISVKSLGGDFACISLQKSYKILEYQDNLPDTKYFIEFGDGTTKTLTHSELIKNDTINHIYNQVSCTNSIDSAYTFIITAERSCTSPGLKKLYKTTTIGPFFVGEPPIPDFYINGFIDATEQIIACINGNVEFDATPSYIGIGDNCEPHTDYIWDFGDSHSKTIKSSPIPTSVVHSYTKPGTYTVTLSVVQGCGVFEKKKTIIIKNIPKPIFEIESNNNLQKIDSCTSISYIPNNICVPVSIPLKNITPYPDMTENWSVTGPDATFSNNNITSSKDNETITLNKPGTYIIKLTSQNECGSNTSCVTITVQGQEPNTTILLKQSNQNDVDYCLGELVDFYTPSNDFLSWKITGINGTPDPSNLPNINSTDPNAIDFPIGKFNIKLNAENNCKTKSDSINIEVHALPIVDAGEDYNGCVEIEIDIDNATTNAIQPQYIWSVLNDGPLPVPNDSLSTKIISSTNGDFDYQLYVKDKYGCSAVDSTTVFVEALPVIKIISTKLEFCKDETDIILTPNPIGGIWNGDVIDASGNVDTKIPGKYIVNYSYITQSINQCQADTNVAFVVNKLPIVDLSPIDTIHCSNLSDILDLDIYDYTTKTSILGTGTWTGKNVTNTGEFDLSSNGNFLLNYEYTESSTGCVNDQNIMLEVGNETLLDLGPNEQFCFGQPFTVSQAQPLGGEWSIAGQFGAVVSPDGIISATKDGDYILTYSFGTGSCTVENQKQVTVKKLPVLNVVDTFSICVDADPLILDVKHPVGDFSWSSLDFGNNVLNSSTGEFITKNTNVTDGIYTIVFDFTETSQVLNCKNSIDFKVEINPLPEISDILNTFCFNDAIKAQLSLDNQLSDGVGIWSFSGLYPNMNLNPTTGLFTPNIEFVDKPLIVTYTHTSNSGCSAAQDYDVFITKPTDPIVGSDTVICYGIDLITLSATPKTGVWEGNIINQNQFDPFNVPSKYVLTYITAKGDLLCERKVDKVITVTAVPDIIISAPEKLCLDAEDINIIVNTDLPITDFSGFSSDISSVITKSGLFSPTKAGVNTNGFDITYTAYESVSGLKCKNTEIISIPIHPIPVVDFVISEVSSMCLDSIIVFENLSYIEPIQDLSYKWSVSEGNLSVNDNLNTSIIFTNAGIKTVSLKAISENSCESDSIFNITISKAITPKFIIDFDDLPIFECGPVTLDFINTTANPYNDELDYKWDFGNGNRSSDKDGIQIVYNANLYQDTVYYVSLSVGNNCGGDLALDSVRIKPKPFANFIFEMDTVCADYQMEFFNKSYGFLYDDVKTFYWDFDDGTTLISNDSLSFKHSFPNIYNKDTTYFISLVAENSCGTNTFKKPLLVVPKNVKAAFEVSNVSGCQPFTVSFESNQLPNTSNTLIWLWGDGENAGASGGFEREYTYLEAGQFTASLQVINGCNIDTAMVKINVKESPKTTFLTDKDNYCFGDSITVLNQTLGDIFSVWMINDTQINRYQPDPFYYDKTGNYEISLTSSIQETGCEMTVNKTVTIQPVPVANFTISESACQTENISLVNLSSGASKYYWVFDSLTYNLPIIEETPRYAFISSGFKEIQLIAENEFGCQDSTIVPITIYPQPQPLFETDISYGCPPLLVDITNRTVNPSITQGLLQWNFGNGNKYTEYYDIANQVYENDSDTIASYFISLIAQNGFGCVDTLIQEITVYPMPKPEFVITPKDSMYVDEALYIFKNETEGNDLTHYWNFGDSTYFTNNNYSVPHQYTMYGTYNVTLKSVLNQCADSISKRVIVLPVMPVSEFAIYDLDGIEYDTIKGCYPLKVVFQDRSLYAEVYNWDFGNNTEYTEKLPPTITYYDAGVYNVSLTTSNIVGNDIIVKNKVVQVFERPLAAFIANPELAVMPNSRINFINHSIGGNEFTWNFGDDSDLNYEFEPQHTYLDTGSYFVSLVALSNIGCIDTSGTERKVQIISGGEVSIPNTFTPNNDGLNDVFKLLSDGVVSMNLKVFNRWGNLIFESEDLETGWDGSFRGTASPSGVYAYKVFLEFSNGISRNKVGEILLIR